MFLFIQNTISFFAFPFKVMHISLLSFHLSCMKAALTSLCPRGVKSLPHLHNWLICTPLSARQNKKSSGSSLILRHWSCLGIGRGLVLSNHPSILGQFWLSRHGSGCSGCSLSNHTPACVSSVEVVQQPPHGPLFTQGRLSALLVEGQQSFAAWCSSQLSPSEARGGGNRYSDHMVRRRCGRKSQSRGLEPSVRRGTHQCPRTRTLSKGQECFHSDRQHFSCVSYKPSRRGTRSRKSLREAKIQLDSWRLDSYMIGLSRRPVCCVQSRHWGITTLGAQSSCLSATADMRCLIKGSPSGL